MIQVLERLAEEGNTLVVIDHNLDVIKRADHIIDLGPEGGAAGGQIVAQGTPEEVAQVPESYTGQYLKRVLGPGAAIAKKPAKAGGKKKAVLTELPKRLKAGDITAQGLPFYSGRIRYFLPDLEKGLYKIRVAGTNAACVRVIGREDALIMQAPYEAVSEDPQAIELVFGRRNTFGPLHQWPAVDAAYGPGNFVTEARDF